MIIDTMTPDELSDEIYEDWRILITTTVPRLTLSYDRERRRSKIKKDSPYWKFYKVKTKKKNNWLLTISKATSDSNYKGISSAVGNQYCYYYTSIGLRVSSISVDEKFKPQGFIDYNSHFFTRYNERMNLRLVKPLDIVEHFFEHNGYWDSRIIYREGKEFLLGLCKEGLMLGEKKANRQWFVWKTFITKNLMGNEQKYLEHEIVDTLQKEIESLLNTTEFDRDKYIRYTDVFKGIKD